MTWLPWIRLRVAALGLGSAALCLSAALAPAQEIDDGPPLGEYYEIRPAVRSLGQEQDQRYDERDRPRYAERQTHRGWEVTHQSFTVVAKTSRADAVWAADEVARAWGDMGAVADHWTSVHRRNNFGIGTFTVIIDNDRRDLRRTPADGLAVTSDHAVIYLNAGPGAPPLRDRAELLRGATAQTFMHVTELDRKLPAWVQEGMSKYVAKLPPPDATPAQLAAAAAKVPATVPAEAPTDNLVEELPEKHRIAADRATPADEDDEPAEEQSTAEAWVRYLIEGEDAKHAPIFFAVLETTLEHAAEDAAVAPGARRIRDRTPNFDEAAGKIDTGALDGLVEDRANDPQGITAWLKDAHVDQPLYTPASDATPAQIAAQKEMAFVLKLARRFGKGPEAPGLRPRITEFGAQGQREVSEAASGAGALDLGSLLKRLTDPESPPWATLDPSGRLLTSDDDERLAQLLGTEQNRYRTETREGKTVLLRKLNQHTTLEGWLEEDKDQPRRPKAKFEVIVGG